MHPTNYDKVRLPSTSTENRLPRPVAAPSAPGPVDAALALGPVDAAGQKRKREGFDNDKDGDIHYQNSSGAIVRSSPGPFNPSLHLNHPHRRSKCLLLKVTLGRGYTPYGFNKWISSTVGGELSVSDARSILRPILRGFQLWRVMASEVELPGHQRVRVEALIPTFTITTIELEMTAPQARAYYKVHEDCATQLTTGGVRDHRDEFGHGRIDALKHRRLWISTLTPTLDAAPHLTTVKRLTGWFARYADRGMSMLFKMLVPPGIAIHGDRVAMAQTMVNCSPKLGWLAKFLGTRCIIKKRKVLMFCHWPFAKQQVEAFLSTDINPTLLNTSSMTRELDSGMESSMFKKQFRMTSGIQEVSSLLCYGALAKREGS
ncbi:hypothetical protein JMJ35_009329 [Cladonia borealis]|uniref:Uncharacterized protein n=1 Tax=Cladonia borealis TaxID=184061 RepID=A0AA39V6K0_9LECA|nr:hypothetical protein JMJ35_009329 [Cladonia borealis]